MHHHYQVLGSGGVSIGAQCARSQPPSTPLLFAWSSITSSLQGNKQGPKTVQSRVRKASEPHDFTDLAFLPE